MGNSTVSMFSTAVSAQSILMYLYNSMLEPCGNTWPLYFKFRSAKHIRLGHFQFWKH